MKMKKIVMPFIKILLLTIIYVIVVSVISGILITVGFAFPEINVDQSTSFLQLIFVGFISSFFIVYLAQKYKQLKKWTFFMIVFFILFLSNISVAIEGKIFTPELITNNVFITLFIQQIAIGLFFAFIATLMNRKKFIASDEIYKSSKSFNFSFILKILLSSFIYMTMYYVWGWINYNLFTKPFYEMGISGLDVPSTSTILKSIFIRGILITISIVPFLKFAQPDNNRKMYETGMILFLFGGLIPLSLTLAIFPLDFVLFSLAEIFLQNFLTGIIIYKILKINKLLPIIEHNKTFGS